MASASRHLCRSLLRTCSRSAVKRRRCSIPYQRFQLQTPPFRPFSSTASRTAAIQGENADEDADEGAKIDFTQLQKPEKSLTPADLDPHERAAYETMTKDEQAEILALQNHVKAVMESGEMNEITEDEAKQMAFEIEREEGPMGFVEERNLLELKNGFWQEDEDDEFGQVPDNDDEFTEDHITSVAESELEVHREVRQYTRIAAWDLPMLLQFTKPFELPDMKTSPLRFRYTTYMGESHPAASKVVVQFTTQELAEAAGLSEEQRSKLIKLVGVRYNPDKDLVHMSCEKFENQAQNKRYLGDLINNLVKESRQGDMFKDVPFDFRHHKPKKVHELPEEWKLQNRHSVQRLAIARDELKLLESEGTQRNRAVDGQEMVAEHVRARAVQPSFARPL